MSYFLYVTNNDVVANIFLVGLNGIWIIIIRPDNFVSCLKKSEIEATCTREERDYSHKITPSVCESTFSIVILFNINILI